MKVKEESEKVDLKLSIHKAKIMASGPISSVQFSSVQSLSPVRLCDRMNRSTLGLPVHHQLHHFMANRWVNNGNSEAFYF